MKLVRIKILAVVLFVLLVGIIYLKITAIREKIHLITTPIIGSDAIILESNGKFAMIDTGEDEDYPDGTYPQYPLRKGTVTDKRRAITDRVFSHLSKIGVKELEFIVITHTHSDHIGNASKIIEKIPTKKLYIKKYSDDRIYSKNRLWDNKFCYDKTIEAAKKYNTQIIQDITEQDAYIKLNNMDIQLYNYENEYKDGKLKKVWDDNVNSILAVITTHNKRFFFGGDLDNSNGKEDKYANIIGKVDIMKFNHHSDVTISNTKNFVSTLSPKIMIKTDPYDINKDYLQWLKHQKIEVMDTGRSDVSAVVFGINSFKIKELTNKYKYGVYKEKGNLKFKLWNGEDEKEKGWLKSNGIWYFVDDKGILKTGWYIDGEKTYFFNKNGELIRDSSYEIDGTIYYFNEKGEMKDK